VREAFETKYNLRRNDTQAQTTSGRDKRKKVRTDTGKDPIIGGKTKRGGVQDRQNQRRHQTRRMTVGLDGHSGKTKVKKDSYHVTEQE